MSALTFGDAVAESVAAVLAEHFELERSAIVGLLPVHIQHGRPSQKMVHRAVLAAGWRPATGVHGEKLYRAPWAQSDPLARRDAEGGNSAGEELRLLIERAERIAEEIKDRQDDRKDVFAEAKGRGYDVKAIKQIIAIRAKSKDEWQEERTILDLYLDAMGMQ